MKAKKKYNKITCLLLPLQSRCHQPDMGYIADDGIYISIKKKLKKLFHQEREVLEKVLRMLIEWKLNA